MFRKFKYHILLHLIILMWGFTGILGKLINLPPLPIVWYRVLIAAASLGIVLPLMERSLKLKSPREFFMLALVGIVVMLHWVTFYMAIDLSTASLGILCLSTTTIHVSWLEPLVMKRRLSWTEVVMGLVVIYGIYFVSEDFSAQDYIALAYGLVSALMAAIFSVMNGKMAQTMAPSKITFYEMVIGGVFLTIILLFRGELNPELFQLSTEDILWLLFLGLLCTSFAFLVTVELTKRLGAFTVSLSINMEPVYTILLAIVILNENKIMGTQFYIGSFIIVAVVLANAIIKRYMRRKLLKNTHLNAE
ncbi:MAG: EamA family transporter [Flavobacteriales bacterium]|nr:EamA family transporter [Flavobacteriales bacterium]